MALKVEMKGLTKAIARTRTVRAKLQKEMKRALTEIAIRWQLEAKKRAPVETGLMRNTIMYEVEWDELRGVGSVAVGSNQKYAAFVEFGTKWIAGGRVLALGQGWLTDAEAVKIWPAKNNNLVDPKTGSVSKRAAKAIESMASGGPQEQMPWLRPAWMAIADWARGRLAEAIRGALK